MYKIFSVFVLSISFISYGQTKTCTQNCTTQKNEPVSTTSTATNSNSGASSAGDSAVSTASGNNITPVISPTQQQNQGSPEQTTTGTISGGNTTSGAQANGNNSSASGTNTGANTSANQSSASGTNKSNNSNTTGASTSNATTGNNKNNNAITGGNQSTKTSASGGAGGSASGGSSRSSTGASTAGASNGAQTTKINTGSTNTNSGNTNIKETFIPNMTPQLLPSVVPSGNVIQVTTACGPLMSVVSDKVTYTSQGLFHARQADNGYTDRLIPYVDANGIEIRYHEQIALDKDGHAGKILYGSQAIIFEALASMSNNRVLGGGGTSASQASGQAGVGGSSSIQQIIGKIILVSCEFGFQPDPLPFAPLVIDKPVAIPEPQNFIEITPAIVSPSVATPVLPKKKVHKVPACVPNK